MLHTVWCYIFGEAAGEIWHWSLVGVKVCFVFVNCLCDAFSIDWKCLDQHQIATYFPPFKHGRWQTGASQRSPSHSGVQTHTPGRTHRPPFTQGGSHTGYWHRAPTYVGGQRQTSRDTHFPPCWHPGLHGALRQNRENRGMKSGAVRFTITFWAILF